MLSGIISGLITAWILIQFGIDEICINVLQPVIPNIILTKDHFYFAFGVIGMIGGLVADILCRMKG